MAALSGFRVSGLMSRHGFTSLIGSCTVIEDATCGAYMMMDIWPIGSVLDPMKTMIGPLWTIGFIIAPAAASLAPSSLRRFHVVCGFVSIERNVIMIMMFPFAAANSRWPAAIRGGRCTSEKDGGPGVVVMYTALAASHMGNCCARVVGQQAAMAADPRNRRSLRTKTAACHRMRSP